MFARRNISFFTRGEFASNELKNIHTNTQNKRIITTIAKKQTKKKQSLITNLPNKQIDKQANKQTHKKKKKQTNKQTNKQKHRSYKDACSTIGKETVLKL